MRHGTTIWLAALVLQVGCGTAATPVDGPNSGSPDAGVDTATQTQPVVELTAGLYSGATDTDATARLGLWEDGTTHSGTLAVGPRAFSFSFGPLGPKLSAIDGACANCTGPWDLRVTSTPSGRLTLDVITMDDGPSFLGLVLTPHDGFKPESAPAPDVEMWAGPVVAVDSSNIESPILDAICEVSVPDDTAVIRWFDCGGVGTDSLWTSEQADSWSRTDGKVSWSTLSNLEFRGDLSSDGESLVGTVQQDGGPIGSFHFTKQTP